MHGLKGYSFSAKGSIGWAKSINELDVVNESRREEDSFVISPLTTSHFAIIKALSLESKFQDIGGFDLNTEYMVVQLDKNYSNNLKNQDVVGVLNIGGTAFSHETDNIIQHIKNNSLKENSIPITSKHKDLVFGDKMLRVVGQKETDFKKVEQYTLSEAVAEIAINGHLPFDKAFSVIFSLDELKANRRRSVSFSDARDSLVEIIMSGAPEIWDGYLQNQENRGFTYQEIGLPKLRINSGRGVSVFTTLSGFTSFKVNRRGFYIGVSLYDLNITLVKLGTQIVDGILVYNHWKNEIVDGFKKIKGGNMTKTKSYNFIDKIMSNYKPLEKK